MLIEPSPAVIEWLKAFMRSHGLSVTGNWNGLESGTTGYQTAGSQDFLRQVSNKVSAPTISTTPPPLNADELRSIQLTAVYPGLIGGGLRNSQVNWIAQHIYHREMPFPDSGEDAIGLPSRITSREVPPGSSPPPIPAFQPSMIAIAGLAGGAMRMQTGGWVGSMGSLSVPSPVRMQTGGWVGSMGSLTVPSPDSFERIKEWIVSHGLSPDFDSRLLLSSNWAIASAAPLANLGDDPFSRNLTGPDYRSAVDPLVDQSLGPQDAPVKNEQDDVQRLAPQMYQLMAGKRQQFHTSRSQLPSPTSASLEGVGKTAQNITVTINVNGNVDNPIEFVQRITPLLRDELKRIDPRYSRAGNKTQI
jgi:hypothetical protein